MSFYNDHKMPSFSPLEGEAAISYIELRDNILEAKETGLERVQSGYGFLTLDDAAAKLPVLEKEFHNVVRAETKRRNPKIANEDLEGLVMQRLTDIIACHENTGYVAPDRGLRG